MLLITAISMLIVIHGSSAACPTGWAENGNFCYWISNTAADFSLARAVCQDYDGDLLAINSVPERDFVEKLITVKKHDIWFGLKGNESNYNSWWWVDGSTPGPLNETLNKWSCEARPNAVCSTGEPLGACGIYRWSSLTWENFPCTWTYPFICKRSNSVVDNCDLSADWHQFSGRCYKNMEGKRSWHDARTACTNEAGQLVMLKNQTYIDAFKRMQSCFDYSVGTWIGLSDVDTETSNTLKWADGSGYNNNTADWASGQPPAEYPNPHKSNCVASYAIDDFKWRINGCGTSNRFMCEKTYGVCAEGWHDYGTGFCYQVVTGEEITWPEARDKCEAKGTNAQLMKVSNQAEQNALSQMLGLVREAGKTDVRIGVSDQQTDNVFRWADGSSLAYTNWNNSWKNEVEDRWDCGYLRTQSNDGAKWGTGYCFNKMPYICRIPIHVAPNTISKELEAEPHPELKDTYTCPSGWMLREQQCYLFLDDKWDYPTSKARCEEQGSKPVTVLDELEQAFISNNMKGATWLGLIYQDSKWIWDDGSGAEPVFKNWAAGGKGDGTNTCSKLQNDGGGINGQWHHQNCGDASNYLTICKKEATFNGTDAPTQAPEPTSPVHPECGVGWSYDQTTKNCFALKTGVSVIWEEANRRCIEEMGGGLASITSPEEQTYINALLQTIIGGAVNYWIGLNEKDFEKGWQWTDGSPVPYFNWNDGEPNNWGGDEYCVELSPSYQARWNDHNCSSLADGYICKKKALSQITTPGPSTTPAPEPTCNEPQAMVSGNMYIQDQFIRVRNQKSGREAYKARMNSGSSWEPSDNNQFQYIEALFPFPRMIKKIQIAGAPDKDVWVTKFHVLYQTVRYQRWHYVFNGSEIMTFTGNTLENKNAGVARDLPEMLFAQGIRIYPQEWNTNISMRFDVHGCRWEEGLCHYWESITGETKTRDDHLTASNSIEGYEPAKARFPDGYKGWETNEAAENSWIQVEFDTTMRIIEIGTKGRSDENRFVKSYKVQVYNKDSPHENKWEMYQEPYGTEKVFAGNTVNNEAVWHRLNAEVETQAVRFLPGEFEAGIAMQIEIKGCPNGCDNMYVVTGTQHSIPDSYLTASTSYNDNHGPNRARLFTESEDGLSGGWSSGVQDQEQWIQADIGYRVRTRGITIQGRWGYDQYVKSFYVLISNDGNNFRHVSWDGSNVTTFFASHSGDTLRTVWFPEPHTARYVRINPRTWEDHISMRFDIQACPGPYSYQSLGCYADVVQDRDLPYGSLDSPSGGMTHEVCVYHCYELGYSFAGTQYGVECFCGNSYGRYGQSTQCNMDCDGDPFQTCGGRTANWVLSTGMSPSYVRCADGWEEWGGKCYRFQVKTGTAAYSWTQAEYECQQDGADLSSINSQAENEYIYSRISQTNEHFWIGLHSKENKFQFTWTNYDQVTYTNWERREPNNMGSGEDCVNMYNNTGRWNDDDCSANIYGGYVCKKDKESLPVATSPAPEAGCPAGWVKYRWKCYHFLTQTQDWNYHKQNCEGWDETSHLVRIKDHEEQAFISSGIFGQGVMFYTDINDKDSFGSFKFSDGSTVHYTVWGSGQPDIIDQESCVAVSSDDGLWYDVPCGDVHGAVCEKLSTTDTQPPTEPTQPPSGSCSADWIEYGDYCYMVKYEKENYRMTWDDAHLWCSDMGANLASIHSVEENDYLHKLHVMDTNANYWVGLSRANTNDSFKWTDGTEVAYVNWNDNEPSNDVNANCVDMLYENGRWRALSCTGNRRSWICKIGRGVQPSTVATVAPPSAGPPGSCSPDSDRWKFYNDKCYYFSDPTQGDGALTWYDARTWCQQNNADLVSIHDAEMNNFTLGQVRDINSWIMWMGLNTIEGSEMWSDGSAVQYTHWAPGQPNDDGGTRMCVGYGSNVENQGSWIHDHCSKQYHFICSKTKGATITPGPEPTPMPGGCPEGYMAFRDKCFFFSEEQLTWQASRDKCYGTNTPHSLASVSDIYDQSFLTSQLKAKPHTYWIGMRLFDGIYVWTDSSHVTYTNWAPHEPNAGDSEQCVHMYHDEMKAGQWNDANCEQTMRYICMKYKDASLEAPVKPSYCPAFGDWEEDYLQFDSQCYKFVSDVRAWSDAETDCVEDETQHGHLVSVMDPYEQAFIMSTYYEQKDISSSSKAWIGLSDAGQEGRFSWTDSRTVTYTNWGGNQPDQPGGGCTYLQFSDGKWIDDVCGETAYPYICKISDRAKEYTRPPSGSCPGSSRDHDWLEYGSSCYLFMDVDSNLANARQDCQVLGAELASIHSEGEQQFIYDHIQLPHFARFWWIGMIRTINSGWQWTDDSPVEFTYWAEGEPSDNGTAGENCVEMYTFTPGGWNDISCEATNGYVCKIARDISYSSSTPEPSLPPTNPTATPVSPFSTLSTTLGTAPATPVVTTRPPSQGAPSDKEPLSAGAMVGIVFGVIALLLLGIVIALVVYRRQQWQKFTNMGAGLENPIYGSQESAGSGPNVDYVGEDSVA